MYPSRGPLMSQVASPSVPHGQNGGGLKLDSIQYLRAVAASAVVLSHSANTLRGHEGHLIDFDYGAYGVDIFFVVSGFIMFYTTFAKAMRPSTFMLKRLIRIFPLYFILSTVLFIMVVASPASFNKVSPDPWAYLESILFVPHWNPRLHDLQPILGPGWTLNYEMFFYVLFAASLFLRHRLGALAVLLALGALVLLGRFYPVDNPAFITYTNPLLLEFGLGIVVALTFTARGRLRWPVVFLIACGLGTAYCYIFHGGSFGHQLARPFLVGLPCAFVVTLLVLVERCGRLPNVAVLAIVGDASYSLYLVHAFVLSAGKRLWQHFDVADTVLAHALFILLILAVSVAAALALYRFVELKITRRLSRALKRFQSRAGAPAHLSPAHAADVRR